MLTQIPIWITVLSLLGLAQCASQTQSNLESARFALDKGEYNKAIELATDVITSDSNNFEAYRILGSAYFGRSGMDFLDLAEVLLDLDSETQENFRLIADALPPDGNLDDLRLAITSMEAAPDVDDAEITNEDLADVAFDLGMMQAIEHFAIGIYQANYYVALDVSGITDAGTNLVIEDLLEFDGRLIGSGVSGDEDFIAEARQTFCILEPISAGEGFTTAEYQVMVGCQLTDDPSTFDTVAITPAIANCDALDPDNQTAEVQDCFNNDTNL